MIWALLIGIGGAAIGVDSQVLYFGSLAACEAARDAILATDNLPAAAVCLEGVLR